MCQTTVYTHTMISVFGVAFFSATHIESNKIQNLKLWKEDPSFYLFIFIFSLLVFILSPLLPASFHLFALSYTQIQYTDCRCYFINENSVIPLR